MVGDSVSPKKVVVVVAAFDVNVGLAFKKLS